MLQRGMWVLLIAGLSASCALNPVTGRQELSLLSEQEEIAMGRQTDAEVMAQFGAYADPALEAYVQTAGLAMAARTQRPGLPYRFAVLDSPVINAFAVPGGSIYLTRGILALMNSEAEMAAVLGHELGHVNARHTIRRLSQMMIVKLGLAVGSALNETVARVSGIAGAGIQVIFLKFSRDDERQADALGVAYSRASGYDPRAMVVFFESLEKSGDHSKGRPLPGFLSTHPLTAERIQSVRAMLQAGDSGLARKRDDYLQKINGLVYGDDPRGGYVEGSMFYHPLLKFEFRVPGGWKLENTPSRVTLAPEAADGALVLQAEKTAGSLEGYARKRAADLENGQILNETPLNLNGQSGYEQSFRVPREGQEPLRVRRSFVRKGEMVFTFTAISPEPDFQKYDEIFRSVPASFRELNDPSRLRRFPRRLALVRGDGKSTLREILRRQGVEENLWPAFAVMNGLDLGTVPAPGDSVKALK